MYGTYMLPISNAPSEKGACHDHEYPNSNTFGRGLILVFNIQLSAQSPLRGNENPDTTYYLAGWYIQLEVGEQNRTNTGSTLSELQL